MVFFFFKQKTAYEIYQCDWSSDVCSSDLVKEAFERFGDQLSFDMDVYVDRNTQLPVSCNTHETRWRQTPYEVLTEPDRKSVV